jgi:hypothetical protein
LAGGVASSLSSFVFSYFRVLVILFGLLYEIEAAFGHAGAIAFGAGAANDKSMAAGVELMLPTYFAHRHFNGGTLKLDHFAALFAAHVFVLRVAVVVLVVHSLPQFQAAQQAGIDKLAKRAINRGPADAETGAFHVVDEPIRVEMMVLAENILHHVALLVGEALRTWTAGQVFAELGFGALRYSDSRQFHDRSPPFPTINNDSRLAL